jgi:hypothetical protein
MDEVAAPPDLAEKLAQPDTSRTRDNVARRPFRTLVNARNFKVEGSLDGRQVVSISPMLTKSYWRCASMDGRDVADSTYESISTPPDLGPPLGDRKHSRRRSR